jgi:glycosyltransferase involved in cell wall biosynthesis
VAEVSNDQIRGMLDDATALVLPSRSEGLGRIVVEALCRGRPVVATRVGGITDLVRDGENGLLVEPRSPAALADALVHVLVDGELAARLAAAARPSVESWIATPEDYARRTRDLVEQVRR